MATEFDYLAKLRPEFAVLSSQGTIVEVNQQWTKFARSNGLKMPNAAVGVNYLSYCPAEVTGSLANDLRELLAGRRHMVSALYPCHSKSAKRWFALVGLPGTAGLSSSGVATLFHLEITELVLGQAPLSARQLIEDLQGAVSLPPEEVLKARFFAVIEEMFPTRGGTRPDEWGLLSPREHEVVHLIVAGKSNRDIARQLGCAENTTKRHVTSIMKKIRVTSRGQIAARFADGCAPQVRAKS